MTCSSASGRSPRERWRIIFGYAASLVMAAFAIGAAAVAGRAVFFPDRHNKQKWSKAI
jgi:hypothetical protein